jgi:hypothetical protein
MNVDEPGRLAQALLSSPRDGIGQSFQPEFGWAVSIDGIERARETRRRDP